MNRYRDNFDAFGNLREDHSPWTLSDGALCAAAVLFIALIVSGVLV